MSTRTKIIAVCLGVFVLLISFALLRNYISLLNTPGSNDPGVMFTYSCDQNKTIKATYFQGIDKPSPSPDMPPTPGGSVYIVLSNGRKMTLSQTLSADGVRYANKDESFIFWSKGNGALVLENNQQKSFIGCIEVAKDSGNIQKNKIIKGYLTGEVTLSPTCPVERIPPDPNCAPKPFSTLIDIKSTTFSIRVHADNNGKYLLTIPVGTYTVKPYTTTPFPKCESKVVEIKENSTSTIDITCDTGIR